MSVRDEVLNYLISTNLVENYIKKLGYNMDFENYDDIKQEVYLMLCEVKEEKWIELLNQGTEKDKYYNCRGYASGLIFHQIRSKNSKIYSKYKKHKENEFTLPNWNELENIADAPFDYNNLITTI